jgi:3-oxoacyl-[acyl-carrier-protein] synthase-1
LLDSGPLFRSAWFPLNSLWLSHFTATSSLGCGLQATLSALRQQRGGLAQCTFDTVDLPTFVGEVAGVDTVQLPLELASFDCRNNRLALLGLLQDAVEVVASASKIRRGVFIAPAPPAFCK